MSESESRSRSNTIGKGGKERAGIRVRHSNSESDRQMNSRTSQRNNQTNSASNSDQEPRSRIIRNDNGEVVEFRDEDGESYKGEQ